MKSGETGVVVSHPCRDRAAPRMGHPEFVLSEEWGVGFVVSQGLWGGCGCEFGAVCV